MDAFSRTEILFGKEGMDKLSSSSVIVFGLGGVGGYAAEALVRSGVGRLALVDFDVVASSNINRQLIATTETVSMKKTLAEKNRLLSINPQLEIEVFDEFFNENSKIDFGKYDYVIDAIDDVPGKLLIAKKAKEAGVKEICCLSAGNKLDPTRFKVGDIYSTSVCPLARAMRKKLRETGIEKLKVVWSDEPPAEHKSQSENEKNIGSVAFATGVAGLIAAGEAIKDIAFN